MRVLIDIGGTHTRIGTCSAPPDGSLSPTRFATNYDYGSFVAELTSYADRLAARPDAVCVSFGVALSKGKITGAGKMSDFVGRALVDDLANMFHCPAFAAHDCICALLHILGGQRPDGSVGYVTISSGIGAATAFADERSTVLQRIRIGHHVVHRYGPKCKCGRDGCLSSFVDSKTLESAMGRPLSEIHDEAFWRDYVEWLSIGLGNLAVMLGLDRLLLGGGVAANRTVRDLLPQAVTQQVGTGGGYAPCRVQWLPDYEMAPMLGAYFLAENGHLVIRG